MMKNIEVTVGLLPDFDIKIEAPVSAADLGGAALPEIKGSADKSAPVISGFTDLTFPDETLSVCGEGLRRASLIVWSEGSLKRITPLRSDDTKLQAVIPADTQKSMLIVWPENENGIGAPVRVNAPTCWFSDTGRLLANTDEQEIRLFGKSLFIEGKKPSVTAICKDKSVKAEIVSANPYRLTIKLNARFYEGEECRFYIHNGTGGKYGFGEPFELTARKITRKPAKELPTLFAEDFGAVADDGKDDSEAFERALEAAAQLGGAVLQLGKGEYNFRKTLYIPDRFPNGLYIRGRGAGDYDFASKLLPDEYEHRGIGGDHTVLRFLSAKSVPENTIRIEGDNISLCDMTVFGADGHAPGYSMAHGYTVHLAGRDITLERVRMIKADLRDFNDDPKARLMCSNHVFVAGGSRNIDILNCEFHTKACAVWINQYEGTDQSVPS